MLISLRSDNQSSRRTKRHSEPARRFNSKEISQSVDGIILVSEKTTLTQNKCFAIVAPSNGSTTHLLSHLICHIKLCITSAKPNLNAMQSKSKNYFGCLCQCCTIRERSQRDQCRWTPLQNHPNHCIMIHSFFHFFSHIAICIAERPNITIWFISNIVQP